MLNKKTPSRSNRGAFGLLAVASLFYAVATQRFYMGFLNDDAIYVTGALSLLKGTYAAIFHPNSPLITFYPPGFSLLLAPFAWLFQPHWEWLKSIPFALSVLNGCLLWRLLRSWLQPWASWMAFALFIFNPGTISLSGMVMSEPLFITLILCSFLQLRRSVEHPTWHQAVLLGFLIGSTTWVRSPGWILLPAVLVSLWIVNRRRAIFPALAAALAWGGLFPLRNYLQVNELSGYRHGLLTSLTEIADPLLLLDNVTRVTYSIFVHTLFSINLPHTPFSIFLSLLITGAVFSVIAIELRAWKTLTPTTQALHLTAFLFACLWFGLLGIWTAIGRRYAIPILPCLAALWASGMYRVHVHSSPLRKKYIGGLILLILGVYTWQTVSDAAASFRSGRPVEERSPKATWAWIQQHLPVQAVLLNPKPAEIYLYTGRRASFVPDVLDGDEYRYRVLQARFSHVLVRPFSTQTSGRNSDRMWKRMQTWTRSNARAFRLEYQNETEGTAVYMILPDPAFTTAYEAYRQARQALDTGQIDTGLTQLRQALVTYPDLVVALNTAAAVNINRGEDLHRAEMMLKHALRTQPDHALSWFNLACLYRRRGQTQRAKECLDNAERVTEHSLEFNGLLGDIQAERAALR